MNQERLLELHWKYAEVYEARQENNAEYHEYRLELINNLESRSLINQLEMERSGFQRTECCTAMDFMIFQGQKKSKALILKWSDDKYGISAFGKKDEMHEIQFCPWCGSKLSK